jgi:hypothetical protein
MKINIVKRVISMKNGVIKVLEYKDSEDMAFKEGFFCRCSICGEQVRGKNNSPMCSLYYCIELSDSSQVICKHCYKRLEKKEG